ncbi:MAG: PSD1 domain-containing protein [Planctomycetaceae bacterium]|nr:PSD1 domain-containing protein [Planctomycetaceae bacterium]
MSIRKIAAVYSLLLLSAIPLSAGEQSFSDEDIAYFERKIRPLLSERCYSCHSTNAKVVHGELRMDTSAGLLQGGESGPLLIPGKPEESLLITAIQYEDGMEMPPKGKLPAAEIAELINWVKRGAPMPPVTEQIAQPARQIDIEAGRQFWSFQPVQEHSLPEVKLAEWPKQRIDHFILSTMEQNGLSPTAPAERATLIRRLTFDLTGLPPTPEEVQAFVANDSPDAYRELVERLLASPQYGEKWGRMWLDLARYTDFTASWLEQPGEAYFYRDWVVQAFNADMPYDEFVHRQLATDLMEETGPEDMPALGLISLSPTYWKELKLPSELIKVIVADEWEERIAAVSGTFLGLTVACARCHDHKSDPITSEDYYALAGVFASTRSIGRPMIPEAEYAPARAAIAEVAKLEEEAKKLNAEIAKVEKAAKEAAKKAQEAEQQAAEQKAETDSSQDNQTEAATPAATADAQPDLKQQVASLTERIQKLKETPHYSDPLASALSEESMTVERAGATPQDGTRLDYHDKPLDLPLFSRGDPNRPGEIVPRGFLKVLSSEPRTFTQGSGRLELAQAMTSDAAPLLARVIVNRIWLGHFGRGLVNTPSDFGVQGDRPTHPELLDDLAARFIANGWSIKWLHREILLSATWQQSSHPSADALSKDPSNLWLSHMNRLRLDFEPWRDAMLSASGVLDLSMGGKSSSLDEPGNKRRTIYGSVHRREMSTTLLMHDFPDPTQHSPKRSQTITALQGLFLLNGPLLTEQAKHLVTRLEQEFPGQNEKQIDRAYWLLMSRSPTDQERTLALDFVGEASGEERLSRWQQYAQVLLATNEFLYLD